MAALKPDQLIKKLEDDLKKLNSKGTDYYWAVEHLDRLETISDTIKESFDKFANISDNDEKSRNLVLGHLHNIWKVINAFAKIREKVDGVQFVWDKE